MMLFPLTFRENSKNVSHPSIYVTDLAAAKEASSSHVTIKCVMNSYTSLDYPSFLPEYTVNPSSTRSAEDQWGKYIRGVTDGIQEVTN